MAPQSYELSFIGSVLVVFASLVLFIVGANILVSALRYILIRMGILKGKSSFTSKETQTNEKDSDPTKSTVSGSASKVNKRSSVKAS